MANVNISKKLRFQSLKQIVKMMGRQSDKETIKIILGFLENHHYSCLKDFYFDKLLFFFSN